MKSQLQIMLDLQESMNARVHPQWREQGFEWYRAIWIECAELMDHYGWKWWKKQTPDTEQVKLELIDIWHFGLSILLIKGVDIETIITELSIERSPMKEKDFLPALEVFAGHTLQHQDFSINKFSQLLPLINMTFTDLYTGYVGKNVLNFFRQDHGYKEGTYQKIWGGLEDNEHLVELTTTLDNTASDFKDQLYNALTQRYNALSS